MEKHRIITLGVSNSGKTCFLASMYQKLQVQNQKIGFYLEAKPEIRKRLNNLWKDIADPNRLWPPGTQMQQVQEWAFTCMINSPQNKANYPVFEFVYWDYPGEYITHDPPDSENLAPAFDIESKAKEADALLVFVDGHKVLDVLRNKKQALLRLKHDLNNLLPIVQKINFIPVHFIITKWDLLEKKFSLREAQECLLQFENFKDIVEQRRQQKMPTRLIPISAVGSDFAELDANGEMQKNRNKIPKPFQIEMSLAFTLNDKFQALLNETQINRIMKPWLPKKLKIEFFRFLADAIDRVVPTTVKTLLIGTVLELIKGRVDKTLEELEREKDAAFEAVKNKQTAIDSVLKSFNYLCATLETNFPESDLCRNGRL